MKIVLLLALIGVGILIGQYLYWNQRPNNLGIHDGRLIDCPHSPNCVSSQAKGTPRYIEPLTGSLSAVKAIILEFPNVTIVEETDSYLHAEFDSKLFRFTDDVEFLSNNENKRIDVRSASRMGYSDLGVNRDRLEEIRKRLVSKSPSQME